ncbi:MAG: outer membrane beta-barrel protein [Vicinamibacteria bacterium]
MSKLTLLLALALPVSALAQDAPRAELSAGYALARASEVTLHGAYAALDLSLGRSFGLEVSGSLQSGSADGTDFDRTTLLAGPRFAWRRGGVTPFVHALGGIVRDSSGVDVFDVSIRVKRTDAAGALGGGVDVPLGRRWALRLQGDYVIRGGEDSEASRASLGVVYRAGAR